MPNENTFEPGKQVEFDPKYAGDQHSYLYQKEEKDLQDKLFQIYEEINEDTDEGYGYEETQEEVPAVQVSDKP